MPIFDMELIFKPSFQVSRLGICMIWHDEKTRFYQIRAYRT
jgi:hypothetical protein